MAAVILSGTDPEVTGFWTLHFTQYIIVLGQECLLHIIEWGLCFSFSVDMHFTFQLFVCLSVVFTTLKLGVPFNLSLLPSAFCITSSMGMKCYMSLTLNHNNTCCLTV